MKKYYYRVFGLKIESEIEIPDLLPYIEGESDVQIVIGSVPDHLTDVKGKGALFESSDVEFIFRFNTIAQYWIQNGERITIQPNKNATPSEITLFLLGSVMGALFHQRGMLALHASAVESKNKSILFIGDSAVGKSSTAAGFQKKGYTVIADDIAVIDSTMHKEVSVFPGIPHLKLWKDTINYFGKNKALTKIRPHIEKYKTPTLSNMSNGAIEIQSIVLLSPRNSEDFKVRELLGEEKFQILFNSTYRLRFLKEMNTKMLHFHQISRIARTVPVYKVERPNTPIQIIELVKFIESEIICL